jgi:mRNA interferase MazF
MQHMTIYKFGDVILVPFPFTDGSSSKKRPAIVISTDSYDRHKPDLILIAVTSQVSTDLQFGEASIADWSAAGLIKPSVIKPAIATIEKTLVIRKLGSLQGLDLETFSSILQQIIKI